MDIEELVLSVGNAVANMVSEMEKGKWRDKDNRIVEDLPCMRMLGLSLLSLAQFKLKDIINNSTDDHLSRVIEELRKEAGDVSG